MSFISKDIWQEYIHGWLITGCAIRSKDVIYFCTRKNIPEEQMSSMWDSEIPSRLAIIFPHREDIHYSHQEVSGFNKPRVGVAHLPKEQGLLSSDSDNGPVSVMGSGNDWPMESIHEGTWPGTYLRCIAGYAYAVGLGRNVHKRTDIGRWQPLMAGFPDEEITTNMGFRDIDGFSEQDLYAAGGNGDLWHFDGQRWEPCGFPSNEALSTVLCAPDGHVYLGGEGCSLWRGRMHTWEKLYKGNSTVLWNELRWFQDKLWLCSDYQLMVWDGEKLERPLDQNGRRVVLSGHMDAYDGILVVADLRRVDLYDGATWQSIVKPY